MNTIMLELQEKMENQKEVLAHFFNTKKYKIIENGTFLLLKHPMFRV